MDAIIVENIHKKFKVYFDKGPTLKEKILFKKRNYYEDRWVLNGVSFRVEKGEALGIIGENGCGKSTLLKLMTKIIYPDEGSIRIRGRVSSLIELGAGFHPDMSGRENIYTNASIFGLTKKEIDSRLREIIEFSELEEFIDNPVRTYSSGMYMRLAFSVAINVDADVLLIDEILAVGDANFQAKCFDRLRELKNSGVTIVIVSHDTGTIRKFCQQAIWIQNGEIERSGFSPDVVDDYLQAMKDKREKGMEESIKQQPDKKLEIRQICLKDPSGGVSEQFREDEPITLQTEFDATRDVRSCSCAVFLNTVDGVCVFSDRKEFELSGKGSYRVSFSLISVPLNSGKYEIKAMVLEKEKISDERNVNFEILGAPEKGILRIPAQWTIGSFAAGRGCDNV